MLGCALIKSRTDTMMGINASAVAVSIAMFGVLAYAAMNFYRQARERT